MKMTVGEIKTNYALLMSITDKKLPVKLSYALSRNLDKLASEMKLSEEQRVKLCEQYALKDEDGKPRTTESVIEDTRVSSYEIDPEQQAKFDAELRELLGTEIEIELMQVEIETLEMLDRSERYDALTPAEIHDLNWMIRED